MKRFLASALIAFLPTAAVFADEGAPPEAAPAPEAAQPAIAQPAIAQPASQAKLVGVILSTSQALVWDGERGEYALKRVGESVDGARIVALAADRLLVERDGAGMELPLDAAPLKAPARRPKRMPAVIIGTLAPAAPEAAVAEIAPAPPVAVTAPVVMVPAAPIRRRAAAPVVAPRPAEDEEVEATVIPRLDLDRELGDLTSLSSQAQVSPAPSGGFSLATVRPGSFVQRVGLRAGDIIVRVDGRPINKTEDAAAAYAWLRVTDRFFVDLLRDGQPLRLHYVIAPAASTAAR